jgi:hypothetical protein
MWEISMLRSILSIFFAGIVATGMSLVATPADATPGMVNAAGCHGHPKHCHGRGELSRNTSGRLYVAGHFSHGGHRHRQHRHL